MYWGALLVSFPGCNTAFNPSQPRSAGKKPICIDGHRELRDTRRFHPTPWLAAIHFHRDIPGLPLK
jgi:hypothetical protein